MAEELRYSVEKMVLRRRIGVMRFRGNTVFLHPLCCLGSWCAQR